MALGDRITHDGKVYEVVADANLVCEHCDAVHNAKLCVAARDKCVGHGVLKEVLL